MKIYLYGGEEEIGIDIETEAKDIARMKGRKIKDIGKVILKPKGTYMVMTVFDRENKFIGNMGC